MLLFPPKGARDRVDSKPRFLLFLFYIKNMDTIQHQVLITPGSDFSLNTPRASFLSN